MPKEKILVAIYDNDLKIRTQKKFEISEDGNKIPIIVGGSAHWMPKFDNTSFLDFKGKKRYLLFGPRIWKRIYFVKRRGDKCVDFSTGEATGPSIEELKKANASTLLDKIGQAKTEMPFLIYALLAINTLFSMIILNALGVF